MKKRSYLAFSRENAGVTVGIQEGDRMLYKFITLLVSGHLLCVFRPPVSLPNSGNCTYY